MNPTVKHLVLARKEHFEQLPLIVSHTNYKLETPSFGNTFYKGYSFLAKQDADKYMHLLTMLDVEAYYVGQIEDTFYLISSTRQPQEKSTVHVTVGSKEKPATHPEEAYTPQQEEKLADLLDETLNKILPEGASKVDDEKKKRILDRAKMVFTLSQETNIQYPYCFKVLAKHKFDYNSALQELKELIQRA
jgi:hypothetical protein